MAISSKQRIASSKLTVAAIAALPRARVAICGSNSSSCGEFLARKKYNPNTPKNNAVVKSCRLDMVSLSGSGIFLIDTNITNSGAKRK